MSDWNSNFDRNKQPPYDPDARNMNATWGWVAAAVFVVIILAVAFGMGHQPGNSNTASNDINPSATVRMAPPPASTAPITPAPNSPAQPSGQ